MAGKHVVRGLNRSFLPIFFRTPVEIDKVGKGEGSGSESGSGQ